MTWKVTPTNLLPDDADAVAYIAAVEAADGEALEPAVKLAYNSFIKGCKADGIWPSIKASCILAGARTLNGALVPLRGTAPTNYNFVAGDYNRKTGLVGDGSTKYLDSNRAGNADPQNSQHISTYATVSGTTAELVEIGTFNGSGVSQIARTASETTSIFLVNRLNSGVPRIAVDLATTTGLRGASRPSSSTINARANRTNFVQSESSVAPSTSTFSVFKRGGSTYGITNCRLAFYSIGEALDLALLDTRVTALVNALAVAIP